MKKGCSPLEAIQAVKAIQDCGHYVTSNYFLTYPKESFEDIARETKLLRRVIHLLQPPKMSLSGFSYAANRRDKVHTDQERYGIRIHRLRHDIWIKEVFGVDLPFSIWSYYYKPYLYPHPKALVTYAYTKLLQAQRAKIISHVGVRILSGSKYVPLMNKELWQYLVVLAWKIVLLFTQILACNFAYSRRKRIFEYIDAVYRSHALTAKQSVKEREPEGGMTYFSWWRHIVKKWSHRYKVQPSYFQLKNNTLSKIYKLPGRCETWSVQLDEAELNILRALYWRRRRTDLHKSLLFSGLVDQTKLEDTLHRFIIQGAIIEVKGWLLSVVNDPGYWQGGDE
jgi:hypothetical protein